MVICQLWFPCFSYVLTTHFTIYLFIWLVCVQRDREHFETQETLSWGIPGNNIPDPLFSRKVCHALKKPGVHSSLIQQPHWHASLLFLLFHRQARQVPLSIADFEAVAFCASFSKGCSKITWEVTSDEKVGNVSFCGNHLGQSKNLANSFICLKPKHYFPHTLRAETQVFGPLSSEPEHAVCGCFSRDNSARKDSLQIIFWWIQSPAPSTRTWAEIVNARSQCGQ